MIPPRQATRFLLCALSVGVAVRLAFFFAKDGMYFPDEIFQYLEPGHARITGSGWLAWEYSVGARNWVLPGLWGGGIEVARAVGLRSHALHRALMLVSALSAVLIVPAGFRLGRALTADARAGVVLALLFACFPIFGFYAPHTLSENPALIVTVWAFALYFELDSSVGRLATQKAVSVGVLLGAAVLCRTSFVIFAPAVMAHLFVRRRDRELGFLLVGFGAVLVVLGLVDALTWGRPFNSVIEFVRANSVVEHELAAHGLAEPLSFYATEVFGKRVGLAGIAIMIVALAFSNRPGRVLATFWLLPLAFFSLLNNKQERFLICVLALLLANAVCGAYVLGKKLGSSRARATAAAALAALGLCVSALPGTLAMPHRAHAGAFRALAWIGTRDDASGVLVDRGENANGGYLLLERSIPLVPFAPVLANHRVFNYVIADSPELTRAMSERTDFRAARTFEGAVVFVRDAQPRHAISPAPASPHASNARSVRRGHRTAVPSRP